MYRGKLVDLFIFIVLLSSYFFFIVFFHRVQLTLAQALRSVRHQSLQFAIFSFILFHVTLISLIIVFEKIIIMILAVLFFSAMFIIFSFCLCLIHFPTSPSTSFNMSPCTFFLFLSLPPTLWAAHLWLPDWKGNVVKWWLLKTSNRCRSQLYPGESMHVKHHNLLVCIY